MSEPCVPVCLSLGWLSHNSRPLLSSPFTDVQVYDAFGYRQAVSTYSSPRTNDPVSYKGQWGSNTEGADTPSSALVMGYRPYSPAEARFTTPFLRSYTPSYRGGLFLVRE